METKPATIESFGESYNSNLIDDLFAKITPEQQEDTDYKMKLAAKIYAALNKKDGHKPNLPMQWASRYQ